MCVCVCAYKYTCRCMYVCVPNRFIQTDRLTYHVGIPRC